MPGLPFRTNRPAARRAACALMLAFLLLPTLVHAQAPSLEAAYVVLGPQGPVARAVLADATACPALRIAARARRVPVRAPAGAAFPLRVCELPIPAGAVSASLENSPLPLP